MRGLELALGTVGASLGSVKASVGHTEPAAESCLCDALKTIRALSPSLSRVDARIVALDLCSG